MTTDPVTQFTQERRERLQSYGADAPFLALSRDWLQASMQRKYVYNFDWMGRPIIQYPQDIVAMQELIWRQEEGRFNVPTGVFNVSLGMVMPSSISSVNS